jgi:hypothetical protein
MLRSIVVSKAPIHRVHSQRPREAWRRASPPGCHGVSWAATVSVNCGKNYRQGAPQKNTGSSLGGNAGRKYRRNTCGNTAGNIG